VLGTVCLGDLLLRAANLLGLAMPLLLPEDMLTIYQEFLEEVSVCVKVPSGTFMQSAT
jgi:hypothetical protein